jgi:hypothetical protein
MNRTNFEHAGFGLIFQFVIAVLYALLGNWILDVALMGVIGIWTGGFFAVGFFIGREHAQAQNKYAIGYIAAFDVRRWSLDARLDLLFPFTACLTSAILITATYFGVF